ncbi:zinc ribbon domain-containing protein [Nocardioides caldifontis]|uniref:zinc ribbon domain-containing protein n=1 Tax=Nocardioides caldifontis TaxID=2588938 RepID=UPI00193994AB|nr:C4-type zinc ribbon domain-containing protein [Nocardioides caldifontis]
MQELDSKLDALRHQAANLPEVAELKELTATRGELDGRVRDLRVQVDDLTREQRKADADVEQVRTRRVRDQQRLDSGAVSHPKELQRLQQEMVSLDRRIAELEDVELEVMEKLEDAQQEVATLEEQLAETDRRIAELTEARDARMAGLREQAGTIRTDRAAKVGDMPADLLALYDRLREQKGGVGAALLRARRCGGCSLELNSAELADVAKKPSDEVVRCDECGRILVRTGESGL